MTIRLDEEIVRFFRSTGDDWQPRLNWVLSVWMHARLAGMNRGTKTGDYMRRRVEEYLDGPRPCWGELQRLKDEVLDAERAASAVRRVELDGRRGK